MNREDVRGLVFDSNHFSPRDQELLTWAGDLEIPTIQISDLGLNQQAVDYVIDGSLDYMVAYGEEKKGLFGPDHVILHHRFRHFFQIKRPYARKTTRLLLALGADCEYRKTRSLIDTLVRHRFHLKILASSALRRSHQKALRRLYPGIKFVGRVESLARPFFEADVALISADDRIYEAASSGTPSLYFHFNKRQEFLADAFANVGLGQKTAAGWDQNPSAVVEQLSSLSRETREKMGMEAKRIVDALGIYRIFRFICDVCTI